MPREGLTDDWAHRLKATAQQARDAGLARVEMHPTFVLNIAREVLALRESHTQTLHEAMRQGSELRERLDAAVAIAREAVDNCECCRDPRCVVCPALRARLAQIGGKP